MLQGDTVAPAALVDLDRSSPVPLYFQIAARFEEAIHSGELASGDRVENEIALSARLRLSRPTIRRAMQELVDRGLLVRRRGVGTQVVAGPISRRVELSSLFDDLKSSGRGPRSRVLQWTSVPASSTVATRLGVALAAPVMLLRRVRLADGAPVAVLENFLPAHFGDLSVPDLEVRGLYELLRERGVHLRVAKQTIGARLVSPDEATLLELPPQAAALSMSWTVYDVTGEAVEVGNHCYRPDRYSFEMTLIDR